MRCTNCGIELHERALHCWKCGQDTPNYAMELAARTQKLEAQPFQYEPVLVTPEVQVPRGKKEVLVYRKHLLGQRLVGWLDEYGNTYRRKGPSSSVQMPCWSVDEQGLIYLEAGEAKAIVGWVDYHDVYAQYGRPAAGFYRYPEALPMFKPGVSFAPDLIFQVSDDGTVYRPIHHGATSVGKVVGAPDFSTIAALALIILW